MLFSLSFSLSLSLSFSLSSFDFISSSPTHLNLFFPLIPFNFLLFYHCLSFSNNLMLSFSLSFSLYFSLSFFLSFFPSLICFYFFFPSDMPLHFFTITIFSSPSPLYPLSPSPTLFFSSSYHTIALLSPFHPPLSFVLSLLHIILNIDSLFLHPPFSLSSIPIYIFLSFLRLNLFFPSHPPLPYALSHLLIIFNKTPLFLLLFLLLHLSLLLIPLPLFLSLL